MTSKLKTITGLLAASLALAGALPAQTPARPPPPTAAQSKEAAREREKKERERRERELRVALDVVARSTDTAELVAAMDLLRRSFPDARPLLAEAAARGPVRLRAFAVQALGEHGAAASDLPVVAAALRDTSPQVRLAAVMAIQRLGKEGFDALIEYLPGEAVANNRKMAVKTLERWGDEAAIPYLVRLLKREKEPRVRNFIRNALQVLSKRNLGDDVEAWEAYSRQWVQREQALRLLSPGAAAAEAKER
jgi:HEAT repeat protein